MKKIYFALLSFYALPLMANMLGEVTINDPVLGLRTIVYEKKNEYAVVEGDILIGRIDELTKPSAFILPKITGSRWMHGIVPFELSEDLPLANKLSILQAIELIQQKTNVTFVELTSKNRADYPDYISFIPALGTICSSHVGRQKGRQVINLSTRCNKMNTVHELGHALGLWHEQSRNDRDRYVRIIWENIEPEHRYNFDQHLTDGKDYDEYDYQSIMHYPAHAFSKNGEKTIIPLQDNVEIGQRNKLSDRDILAINAMYAEVDEE